MVEKLPPEFIKELEYVSQLHEQAVCNHEKCREFSEHLSAFLVRIEDMKYYKTADRVMSVLITAVQKKHLTVKKQHLWER